MADDEFDDDDFDDVDDDDGGDYDDDDDDFENECNVLQCGLGRKQLFTAFSL